MKRNNTKRALVASILVLCLSFATLAGTTFAWFTDSVTSGSNVIKSGNLDVEMYWADGKVDPASATWADASETAIFDYDNWEPGYVDVKHVKISNLGSLALKYQISIVANGDVSALSDVIDVYYVDPAKAVTGREALTDDMKIGNLTSVLANINISGFGELEAGKDDTVTIALKMREDAGNDYMGQSIGSSFSIVLFATQNTVESDSFDNMYDEGAVIARTQAEAQAALDNASKGTTIYLTAGVNYGTLYLRPYDGGAATKTVDWIGNNYGWETYTLFEDVTIVGSVGAVVDAIEIEGGTYYYTEHSQDDAYPVMLSLVELKNVVIDGVTFSGKGGYDPEGYGNVINLSGNNIKVDGLTVKNCVLDNEANNARLIYKTESTTHVHNFSYEGETYTFTPSLKDITVTGCTFNGGYMGLELRETENVTITNNTFNVGNRNILLPANTGCTYTGTVTITGNVSNNAMERFVRADGMGDAVVVIKDNAINNYMASDADYIKVTNANNVTVENNPMTRAYGASNADELRAAISSAAAGETVILTADITLSSTILISNKSVNIDGNSKKIIFDLSSGNGIAIHSYSGGVSTVDIKNATIIGHDATGNYASAIAVSGANSKLTLTSCAFSANSGDYVVRADGAVLTIADCSFIDNTASNVVASGVNGNSNTVVISGSEFKNNTVAGASVVYLKEGSGASVGTAEVSNCKFIANTVNSNTNAAVVYCDTTTIKDNEFENNVINATGARAGVIVIDAGAVSGNSFADNTIASTAAGTVYKATIVSKGDVGTELVLSNNTSSDYANAKGNTVIVE